ncbi:cysteine desulfurase-like protein [Methylocaldum sp. RMAD-M]|jgi:cysteine desulfurase family protein (TIGR01976 family)|uniref:cysteine desulfurase-like protein n=1 Tax=Methylocaldum sp. RMAD-M TaxID=2806557 RepID=UPI000A32808D|nr:cysteine desulfurase-like protein [Methylocaldum sp. RMAD-M]MBP1151101.1 cysteine desulfurase family protein (TIGR01976 family) [Methylocaldum sp. RMAD-M]
MASIDLEWIRSQFPALAQGTGSQRPVFFDGPGGTQVPQSVMDAMSRYLATSNANAHGAFVTSRRTDELIASARAAVADFLGCSPDEVIFGANMTTLAFAFSRAIGRSLKPGDEIVVTRLDHYANVSPWYALEEVGAVVRVVDIHVEDCTLDMSDLERQLSDRTRVVAIGYASNAVGTVNDVAKAVRLAHAVGALVFVDAVHYAPHGPIDVRALDCDFLACSAYKFFGPHVGILFGKREHLARFRPYKVQPAPDEVPSCWETGTLNHEGLAGLIATIDYLAELGRRVSFSPENCRDALIAAMEASRQYERRLSERLIQGLLQVTGLKLYGITDPARFDWRTPTVAVTLAGHTPYAVAERLGDRGIFTWHGNFYALGLTEKLGLESTGGLLRIGLLAYNTFDEIDCLLNALDEISAASA